MSVWQDKNGYRYRVQRAHRQIKGSAGSLAEAKALEAKALRDLAAWRSGAIVERMIEEALLKWMDSPDFRDLKSAHKTQIHMRALLPFIDGKLLSDIIDVAETVKQTLRRAGNKPATVNRKLAILRVVANLAFKRWRWLPAPLGTGIQMLPERNERQVYLSKEETEDLINAVPHTLARAAITLYAYTGWRTGEVHRLKPGDVKGDFLVLPPATKNDQPRMIPILEPLRWALAYLPLQIGYSGVRKHFLKAKRAIGRPELHAHDLRHSLASWIVNTGGNTGDVQAWLGHKSQTSSKRYAHLSPERLLEVARKIG